MSSSIPLRSVRLLPTVATLSMLLLPVDAAGSVRQTNLYPDASARPTRPATATAVRGAFYLAGREDDARVARIAFRLAVDGRQRCPVQEPVSGLVLQHLSQFQQADRPALIAALPLDRGPGVIVVVPGSPADRAGIRAGDIVLTVDDTPLPPDPGRAAPFSAAGAHARADMIDDLLMRAAVAPFTVTVLRAGASRSVRIAPISGCPARVRLARSDQHNAYADPQHVYLTTAVVALARSDDELAFVIAHEMAHVILGHPAIMRAGEVHHGLGRTLGRSGQIIRETERAADRLGGELMLDAGYDPVAGAGILDRLGGMDLGLFATHDSTGSRIAAMRALVQARRTP